MASAVQIYSINDDTDTLVRFDTDALTETSIGSLGVAFQFGDIAYNTSNNTMYMVDGRGDHGLYTIDLSTGAATLIGTHGVGDLFGLAWDASTNTMFASQFAGGTDVFTVDLSTGAATSIGNSNIGFGGMVVNTATGQLVGINDGSGGLYSIDRSTGAGTLIASPGGNNDSGLTYDAATGMYWDIDWSGNVFQIDPSNAYTRTTIFSGLGSHDGAAIVPVPEPFSIAALGMGALALIRRKRKA